MLDYSVMELDLTKIMVILESIISKKIENIKDKSEKQKKEIFAAQSLVLINLSKLVKKRGDIINQFAKGKIITNSEKKNLCAQKNYRECNRRKIRKRI